MGRREHYWIATKGGGIYLRVFLKGEAKFRHEEWQIAGENDDDDGVQREALEAFLEELAPLIAPPIRIDPNLKPVVAKGGAKANDEGSFVVLIRKGGGFFHDEKPAPLEQLTEAMKVAHEEKGDGLVLKIEAELEVEFKFVQRVIKAGAKVGLKKVAYAALEEQQ